VEQGAEDREQGAKRREQGAEHRLHVPFMALLSLLCRTHTFAAASHPLAVAKTFDLMKSNDANSIELLKQEKH
jgi:hypothetical protein